MEVKDKKLGKQGAWGQAFEHLNLIELDIRLVGKKHLEILLHEILHILEPEWSETKVKRTSKEITKVLWLQKYRRIDDKERQPKENKKLKTNKNEEN